MTIFEQAFKIVVGEEGGFSSNPKDPGNWTSGICGRGLCHGTKYGIAASAHPNLDIAGLTLEEAYALYQSSYWQDVCGDALPPPLALLVFDAAVNCGSGKAIRWLQTVLDCVPDGAMGPVTIAAAQATREPSVTICAQFQALRLTWMTTLPTWRTFGLGWARRLCSLPYNSLTMGEP